MQEGWRVRPSVVKPSLFSWVSDEVRCGCLFLQTFALILIFVDIWRANVLQKVWSLQLQAPLHRQRSAETTTASVLWHDKRWSTSKALLVCAFMLSYASVNALYFLCSNTRNLSNSDSKPLTKVTTWVVQIIKINNCLAWHYRSFIIVFNSFYIIGSI